MAAGFIHSSFFGRVDLYSTGYWSYSNNYLADTKVIQATLVTTVEYNNSQIILLILT